MHDERLQDAALFDVLSELCKRVLGELGARVVRILVEHRHGDEHRPAVAATGQVCSGRDRGCVAARYDCSRRSRYGLMQRGRPWFRVEQIELNLFRHAPWQTHGWIVPLPIEEWKSRPRLASWPRVVPWRLNCTQAVSARLAVGKNRFNFPRRLGLRRAVVPSIDCLRGRV
jgi:hypothetical protein